MCYKRREKETQILKSLKIFMKTHIVQQTKHQLRHDINWKIVFELQGIEWNLSMMRINYKLTKRTKIEKYKKSSKMNNIINCNTNRYKLTTLSNIIHLIFNWKPMRAVSILRLHEEKSKKTANSMKNWARKLSKPIKNWAFFPKKFCRFI